MNPATHLYIVTGASRGLGSAIARRLAAPGHRLLCLARGLGQEGDDPAGGVARIDRWQVDLQDGAAVAARLADWLGGLAEADHASATLINNAALLPPPVPLRDAAAADTAAALRVGLEAPMLLTSAFLSATRGWRVPRKVLNISSGLGRRPMASQAAYCALKAGMDMFTRCAALDEALLPHGARLCSLAPGVIDTDMQRQLRGGAADAFPDVARFAGLHREGRLSSADATAREVLNYLGRADFGGQATADVRD